MTETTKTRWVVELTREIALITAERFTITTSGALVLENGGHLTSEPLVAYSAAEWVSVALAANDEDDEEAS